MSINNCFFEYVASGMSFTRINAGLDSLENHELNHELKDMFAKMQKVGTNHYYSLLYNGLTEEALGKCLNEFKDSFPSIYADSGGLQIQTQGKKVTEEIKLKVYECQGNYSNRAFIFDETPVRYASSQLSKHDIESRWYDDTKVDECAIITGKNTAKQIETFIEKKVKTKVMLIVHGNCLNSYQRTLDLIIEQIPKEHYKYITGLAIAGGCLGKGTLEDVKKAIYFANLESPLNIKHLHILGVGAAPRMLPLIICAQSGIFKDLRISYDSTTHTSGITQGRHYTPEGKTIHLGKHKNKKWIETYEDVMSKFNLNVSFEDYINGCLSSSFIKYEEKYGTKIPLIRIQMATVLTAIWNFITELERYIINPDKVKEKLHSDKSLRALTFLYDIKTLEDFKSWEKEFSRYVKSTAVTRKGNDLEEFFS